MPLIAAVRATAVSDIIVSNPAPVPGSVVSRGGALEALSSSRVDLDAASSCLGAISEAAAQCRADGSASRRSRKRPRGNRALRRSLLAGCAADA